MKRIATMAPTFALLASALLAAPVAAQAPVDVGVGSETKKAEKKDSLFDDTELKKDKKERPKRDPNAIEKGEFNYERLEQLSFDKRAQALQAKKSGIRKKMIKDMEDFVARKGGGADEPERMASIYFRLAETWWEETHYQYLLARDAYNKELQAFEKKLRSTKPTEPVENYQKSITYYEKVLQQFPNYKRIDEVIYRLGKAALSQGKALGDKVLTNKGVQYLNQLIQKHQRSIYIPNSHLALAEHFFDSNNLTLAKMNYERIVQNFRSSNMFNYALYKLGWVYFNLREFERAVETFQSVVREIDKSKEKQIEFKEQALNDLVPAYAELERGWPAAKEYFTKVEGEKKMWVRLEKLAAIYVANDKQDLAIELHGHFIEQKPTDPRCVTWWETIVDIYMSLEKFEDIEQAIRKFLAFTDERTSPWVAANKNNGEAMDKARRLGETYLIYMSNRFHQTAQKIEEEQKSLDAARPYYVKAANDYAEFVRRYPNSKKAYIVNFYYAEILFMQLKDFERSREQYKRVIELDKQGEYLEDAALGVIYSVEELLKRTRARYDYDKKQWIDDPSAPPLVIVETSEGGSSVKKTKQAEEGITEEQIKEAQVPKKRQELHPLERDFVDAADKYVKLMEDLKEKKGEAWMKKKGRGKDVPGIMYVAAATYFERGQYPESVERLERVFNYDQARVESEIAVKTLIDIYARQKNWVKIEEWARKMLDRRKLQLFKVKDLRKYVAISVGEQARELAERKDFDGAHAKYDTILREFRKDEPELAATSLFNKAAIYEIQKEEKKAIQTYERVVKEFKNSEVAPEAMFNIGMIYEAQTQFKEAADAFLKMAKIRKNADAAQALINAGQILNALGQHKEAAAAYTDFIKLASGLKGDDEEGKRLAALVPDAHLEIGRVYERMGADGTKNAVKYYGIVAAKFGDRPELQVEAIGRSMKLMIDADRTSGKAKNQKAIQASIKKVLEIWQKEGAKRGNAQYYFAQALFQSAEYLFDAFARLSLKDVKNMKGLRPMLEKQAVTLKDAEKSYFEVIDNTAAGQGKYFAACAAYKIGMLYYRFKEDLFNAPLPKQVQRAVDAGYYEVEERYRQAIEQVAAPIEEQSLVALRGAIQTAHNLGAYNDCTRAAGEVAAKVNPNEYPTVEKDPNLPKATTALDSNKTTDTSSSAAFITRVRRGKYTVSYKPETIEKKLEKKAPAERK